MIRKTALVLVITILVTPLYSIEAMSRGWHSSPPRYYQKHHYYYRGHHHDDALFWGVAGLILGTVLISSIIQPPPRRVVYADPQSRVYNYPQSRVYNYPPDVPPGMCRWERYILDSYGRIMLDRNGQPIKQYTLGSCRYPPPN
ncbi:MAG: hypothetical protein SCH71_04920 [Desulfobulbaceae bacterium]|nr:hypothetical protein [Desulfobulbaceae bacterium]